jgi:hypothetical protein
VFYKDTAPLALAKSGLSLLWAGLQFYSSPRCNQLRRFAMQFGANAK